MPLATFEGLALGATTAASAGFDFLSSPSGGGATVISDAYRGTRALRLSTGSASGSGYGERSTSLGVSSSGTLHVRCRFRLPVLPPDATGVRIAVVTDSPGAFLGDIRVTSSGAVQLRDTNSAIVGTLAAPYVAGQWLDLGLAVLVFSATVGQLQMVRFSGQDSIAETITSGATLNTLKSGGANKLQIGAIRSSGANLFKVDIDDLDHSTSGAWPSITPAPSVRYGPWSGAITPEGFTATYWLAGANTARLVVSTSSDLSSPVYGPSGAPDADGVVKLAVAGLAADTVYHYGVEAAGVLQAGNRGQVRTFPPAGSAASFSIAFGSCQWTEPTASTFEAIRTRSGPYGAARLLVHMGDLHYRDWAPGVTAADVLDQYRVSLASAAMGPLLAAMGATYTWDNHDGSGDTGDGTSSVWPVVAAGYRKVWPHYPLSAGNGRGCHQSWVIGRVRFIQLDPRSYRSPQADADGPSKTMLGSEQKQWLLDQLVMPEPVKIIAGSYYWRQDAVNSGRWGSYATEFTEINAFITANRAQIGGVYVCFGDRHALAGDDGNQSGAYGIPSAGGAPFQQGSVAPGGGEVWSAGYWYGAAGGTTIQGYGWLDIHDQGDQIVIDYKGISSLDGVTRTSMTTTFVTAKEPAPGLPVF